MVDPETTAAWWIRSNSRSSGKPTRGFRDQPVTDTLTFRRHGPDTITLWIHLISGVSQSGGSSEVNASRQLALTAPAPV